MTSPGIETRQNNHKFWKQAVKRRENFSRKIEGRAWQDGEVMKFTDFRNETQCDSKESNVNFKPNQGVLLEGKSRGLMANNRERTIQCAKVALMTTEETTKVLMATENPMEIAGLRQGRTRSGTKLSPGVGIRMP